MASDMAPISFADFETWLNHPITAWVQRAASELADDRRDAWIQASWEAASADAILLRELRGQAAAHMWLADLTYHAVCEALQQGEVPE